MAALQCEICGGKLMAKSGGIFECDSCGMQYDKTRIQEMVQEIRGTVKVEGTVQVEGTVKLDGPVKVEGGTNKDALIKRGWMALEDKNWASAALYFDQALNADAECAEAYLGKLCAKRRVENAEQLGEWEARAYAFEADYQKAQRFADAQLRARLEAIEAESHKVTLARQEAQRLEAEKEARAEQQRLDAIATGEQRLRPIREKLQPLQNCISVSEKRVFGITFDGVVHISGDKYAYRDIEAITSLRNVIAVAEGDKHTVALTEKGTVITVCEKYIGDPEGLRTSDWHHITAIDAGQSHTVGLRSDGTVLAVGDNHFGQCNVSDWKDIVAVKAGSHHTVGLKADGTVVAVGANKNGRCNVSGWTDIVSIATARDCTAGLKADGTVVTTNFSEKVEAAKNWVDIVAVATSPHWIYGLKADGSVVSTYGYVPKVENVVAIALSGGASLVCLMKDGTVKADGYKHKEETGRWKLFDDADTYIQKKQERVQARIAYKAELASLNKRREALGLFDFKGRKEIDAQIAALEAEIRKL